MPVDDLTIARSRSPWTAIIAIVRKCLAMGAVGIAVSAVLVTLAGCQSTAMPISAVSAPAGTSTEVYRWRSVGPREFAEIITEPGRVTMNVHIPYEGDIAGTDLSMPFDQIQARSDALPQERATPVAVYCRSGRMSQVAAITLTAMGYRDIVELAGGTVAWEGSGRTLVWR